MKAYGRKAQARKSREFVVKEAQNIMEYSDLTALNVLHGMGLGRFRLERFYRGFNDTYADYKRRYLASDESSICGDRTDTFVLKRHLSWIGFDYDALDISGTLVFPSPEREKNAGKAQIMRDRAIVMREALPVLEHFNLVALSTLHKLEKYGQIRLARYFLQYQKDFREWQTLYLAADSRTITGEMSGALKDSLLGIGFDYDALVNQMLD